MEARAPEPAAGRRRVLRVAVGLAVAAVAVLVIANSRDELLTAADQIRGVAPLLLLLAVLLELTSYTAYAGAQRVLLSGAGGPPVGLGTLTTTAVVAQAAANCVPGGVAVTALVSFRQLTRRGVPRVLVGWVLALSSGAYLVALAVLALVAVQVAGQADPVPGLRALSLGLVALIVVLAAGALLLVRRADLPGAESRARRWLAARRHGPWAGAGDTSAQWTRQLRTFGTRPAVLAGCLGLMLLSWAADLSVLVMAFHALGTTAPGRGLLLAYCAGQLAASVPVTPGGLGVVEGSLTLALVAFGGDAQGTLTAVLLYRMVSFWALLPAGAAGWVWLRRAALPTVPGPAPVALALPAPEHRP